MRCSVAKATITIAGALFIPARPNDAHCHIQQRQIGALSSLFTKNMSAFNEWRSFSALMHYTESGCLKNSNNLRIKHSRVKLSFYVLDDVDSVIKNSIAIL